MNKETGSKLNTLKKAGYTFVATTTLAVAGCGQVKPEQINPQHFSNSPSMCHQETVASFQTPPPTVEVCVKPIGELYTKEKIDNVLEDMKTAKSTLLKRSALEFQMLLDNEIVYYAPGQNTISMDIEQWAGWPDLSSSSYRIRISTPHFDEIKRNNDKYYNASKNIFIRTNEEIQREIIYSLLLFKATTYYQQTYGNNYSTYKEKSQKLADRWFAESIRHK